MAELHLGQLFDSQQEAEQFVTSYCARNYHPVTQRHMVTVTSYNKKVGYTLRSIYLIAKFTFQQSW